MESQLSLTKSQVRVRPIVFLPTPPITLYPSCFLTPLSAVRLMLRYLLRSQTSLVQDKALRMVDFSEATLLAR